MTRPRVSFIVPVRNDEARLDRCLRSILQNIGAARYDEIIVVDHGSTDGSAAVGRRHGARVLTVREPVRVSELRNRGARAAIGHILAFVDADNEIVAGWTMAAIESLREPGVGAVGALCLAPLDGTWVQRAYGTLRGRASGIHTASWLGSGNMAVWREAFDAGGGFDTSLDTCEDVDFCQRLRARGGRIVSDARMKNVHHGDPATLGALFQGERWRGRDNVRVSFRRPLQWSALPSALVSLVDAAMIGVAAAGLVAALIAPRWGLLVALLAATIITAGAGVRVLRAMARDRAPRSASILQVFVVACVYDFGRACAVLTPAPHRTSRSETAAVTP